MSNKESSWVEEQELKALNSCIGIKCSYIDMDYDGLTIIFDEKIKLTLTNTWKVMKGAKFKFGIGDMPIIMEDDNQRIFNQEAVSINNKLNAIKGRKCEKITTGNESLRLYFDGGFELVCYCLTRKYSFWTISKKLGQPGKYRWAPVFD